MKFMRAVIIMILAGMLFIMRWMGWIFSYMIVVSSMLQFWMHALPVR
jgi:hypothetical protein